MCPGLWKEEKQWQGMLQQCNANGSLHLLLPAVVPEVSWAHRHRGVVETCFVRVGIGKLRIPHIAEVLIQQPFVTIEEVGRMHRGQK